MLTGFRGEAAKFYSPAKTRGSNGCEQVSAASQAAAAGADAGLAGAFRAFVLRFKYARRRFRFSALLYCLLITLFTLPQCFDCL